MSNIDLAERNEDSRMISEKANNDLGDSPQKRGNLTDEKLMRADDKAGSVQGLDLN